MRPRIHVLVPPIINVGAFPYQVIKAKKYDQVLKDRQFVAAHYATQGQPHLVFATTLGQNETNNAFLHEVGHAIDRVYLGAMLEEAEVAAIASGYHQVFDQLGIDFTIKRRKLSCKQ